MSSNLADLPLDLPPDLPFVVLTSSGQDEFKFGRSTDLDLADHQIYHLQPLSTDI